MDAELPVTVVTGPVVRASLAPEADRRRKQAAAHDLATEAWSEAGLRSPIGGLAERVRGSGKRRKNPAEYRRSQQVALRRRQEETYQKNLRGAARPAYDGSRYFPHQGPRECARRVRQAEKAALGASQRGVCQGV